MLWHLLRPAPAHHMSGVVDRECPGIGLLQRTQSRHQAVLPDEGAPTLECGIASSHHLTFAVDAPRGAMGTAEGAQISHDSVLPKEGVDGSGSRLTPPDHLTRCIDSMRGAGSAPKGAQVCHDTLLPDKGVGSFRGRRAGSHYLPRVVDVVRLTDLPAQRAQVHNSVSRRRGQRDRRVTGRLGGRLLRRARQQSDDARGQQCSNLYGDPPPGDRRPSSEARAGSQPGQRMQRAHPTAYLSPHQECHPRDAAGSACGRVAPTIPALRLAALEARTT